MTDLQITDLIPDAENARAHNDRNVGMIVDALQEVGAARSIVIDENSGILAGNATVKAAIEAGIKRVQVVDVDGDTLVAVRRSGLTDAEKKRLAIFDNRTAELAEWDAEQILALSEADDDLLDGLFDDDELTELLAGVVEANADDWANAFGGLPDSDRAPFQQMTFTLHDSQVEQIKDALGMSKKLGGFDTPNENSNGNALARICETFLTDYGTG